MSQDVASLSQDVYQAHTSTNTDYEAELQSYVSSLALAATLRAQPRIKYLRNNLTIKPEHEPVHLTHHTLAASDALPVPPIVFVDDDLGRIWSFYRLGPALSGHHGVVHGGLSATLLDEVMNRASFPMACALLYLPFYLVSFT